MDDNVTLIAAFSGGLLSFLSPCVLPMVPVYLASLYGPEIFEKGGVRWPVFFHAFSFVIGFSLVFVLLGAIVGLTGYAVNPDYYLLKQVAGGLLIAFGALLLAAHFIPFLNFEKRLSVSVGSKTGYFRSLVIGAVFSLSWTACVGPILGSILTLAASEATAWRGAYLLAIYSLGLGLPFLVIGIAFDYLLPLLRRIQRYSGIIHIISGILLLAVGILILTGDLDWFARLAA
jgi:cytochrome c-type biogenesis protein